MKVILAEQVKQHDFSTLLGVAESGSPMQAQLRITRSNWWQGRSYIPNRRAGTHANGISGIHLAVLDQRRPCEITEYFN